MSHVAEGAVETVNSVSFSFLTNEEVRKPSVGKITKPDCLDGMGRAVPRGLYDPSMGALSDNDPCQTCCQRSSCPEMGVPNNTRDWSSEMEVDAFRRLFPLLFYDRHLIEAIRPDARPLKKCRDTSVALGAVATADGSALAKIGSTTMLASIKMEVMTPSAYSPDEGYIAVEYYMPPICSPIVRPGRPAEVAPVISKQLSDTLLSSGMIDLKELSIISGKAAWMAYLDIYCLDADGALFDAALLSAVAAFSHLNIPAVSLNDDGKLIIFSEEPNDEEKIDKDPVSRDRRRLAITNIPFSLTCVLHNDYILSDPTGEEESIMETSITIVLDTSDRLISLYKPDGPVLACSSSVQECVSLMRQRIKELWDILSDSIAGTNVD